MCVCQKQEKSVHGYLVPDICLFPVQAISTTYLHAQCPRVQGYLAPADPTYLLSDQARQLLLLFSLHTLVNLVLLIPVWNLGALCQLNHRCFKAAILPTRFLADPS